MNIRSIVLLVLALAPCATHASFIETFDSGALPAGWFHAPVFNYGTVDFANGRVNAYATDSAVQILRSVDIASTSTKLVITYEGNLAFSGIGESNWSVIGMANGDHYYAAHGYGDHTGAGIAASMVSVLPGGWGPSGNLLGRVDMARTFDLYSYTLTLEDGKITHSGLGELGLSFSQTVIASGFSVQDVTSVGLALYTTTSANVWIDNFAMTESASVPEDSSAVVMLGLGLSGLAFIRRTFDSAATLRPPARRRRLLMNSSGFKLGANRVARLLWLIGLTITLAAPSNLRAFHFTGLWSGTLSGETFSIEIDPTEKRALFTGAGLPSETLLFVDTNPVSHSVNLWREHDHAAIVVYGTGSGVSMSYLEDGGLRTVALTHLGVSTSSIGTGPAPVAPTSTRFEGTWSGLLVPGGPSIEVSVAPGGLSAQFTDFTKTDGLTYLGFSAAGESQMYWRAQDHAFVNLYDVGGTTQIAYLEDDFYRSTQPLQVPESGSTSLLGLAGLGMLAILRRRSRA